jgi:hypothetical protein
MADPHTLHLSGTLRHALWERNKVVMTIASAFWLTHAASLFYGLYLFLRLLSTRSSESLYQV